jgi:NTP pyrophosphatase (non-canonical NTP hydrolase)
MIEEVTAEGERRMVPKADSTAREIAERLDRFAHEAVQRMHLTSNSTIDVQKIVRYAIDCALADAEARVRQEGWDWRSFSVVNRQRCESPVGFNHALKSWTLSDWFTAVVGELGEAANIAKKLNRVRDGIPGNKETPEALRQKLGRELADAVVYLDLLAQSAEIDLPAAVEEVFNAKSDELGCPIRFNGSAEALSARLAAVEQALRDIRADPFIDTKQLFAKIDSALGDPQ